MAKVGEDFAKYAEKLVFDCCRHRPTLSVIQGMCILSFRSLSIGKDHLGWMFISMAGGLCVHLRLHVLALDECAGRALKPTSPEIRTFWMFYFVDVPAITILGRNCALPWRRVNVPEFHTTLNAETADLAELSFAWQSQLWYTHAEAMDQILTGTYPDKFNSRFAPSFEKLAMAQQIRLLVSTLEQLNTFFCSKPHQLHMNIDAPKPIVFFHLQYHMAIMIIISSFLRSFTSPDTPGINEAESNSSLLVLRSITSAASETIRLCRLYRDRYTFTMAHPIIVHHLLSAILVHLMNATSSDIT
ncbi:fungal specific transcription factor domain-containing protein [Colletotrichum asianum]